MTPIQWNPKEFRDYLKHYFIFTRHEPEKLSTPLLNRLMKRAPKTKTGSCFEFETTDSLTYWLQSEIPLALSWDQQRRARQTINQSALARNLKTSSVEERQTYLKFKSNFNSKKTPD